jgi:hypothetical protein
VRSAIHARRNRELTLPGYFRSLRGPRLFAFWHPLDFRIYPALVRGFLAFLLGASRSRWRRWRGR